MSKKPVGGLFLLALISFLFIGCRAIEDTHGLWGDDVFYTHRSPMVKYPSSTFYTVGFIAGMPAVPPGLVIDFAWHACTHDDGMMLFAIAVPAVMGSTAGTVVGVPSWVLWGWWWPEDDYEILEPEPPDESKEEPKEPKPCIRVATRPLNWYSPCSAM